MNKFLIFFIQHAFQLKKSIQKENSDQLEVEQEILQFGQYYSNLGSLAFIFDPYNQEEKHLLIEITCESSRQQNSLNQIMQAKSFKCQLGEFYVSSGCQICQSSYGFYSVVYDTMKCSIFDQTKQKNITENNIEIIRKFLEIQFYHIKQRNA